MGPWDVASKLADEFAKGGLVVFLLAVLLAGALAYIVWNAREQRADRKTRDSDEDILRKFYEDKIEALRDRYQEKFETLLDKYNESQAAGIRQTEGFISAAGAMKDLIVDIKGTVGSIKDQLLILSAKKGGE